MSGAEAQQIFELLRALVEQISGPQFDFLQEAVPMLLENLQMIQGCIMASCGCIVGWFAGNELLRCLW